MDIAAKKLELIQWLTAVKDETTLARLQLIKEHPAGKKDWWNTLSESVKASIEEGEEDIRKGRTISHEKVRKRYEKWL